MHRIKLPRDEDRMVKRTGDFHCPLCGDADFESVDFHMSFGLDGVTNELWGERCSTCGHVLLFLNRRPPSAATYQELVIQQLRPDHLN